MACKYSESTAPLGMVACSKAFLETEIWEFNEILSLENVFIQIVMKKVVVIFQETAAGSLQSSRNSEPNLSSSLLSCPCW